MSIESLVRSNVSFYRNLDPSSLAYRQADSQLRDETGGRTTVADLIGSSSSFGGVSGGPVARPSGAGSSFVNHLGTPTDPGVIRAVTIHRRTGDEVLWLDQHGNRVNDSALPTPVPGLTATFQNGAWIYGGQTADGARPRGV